MVSLLLTACAPQYDTPTEQVIQQGEQVIEEQILAEQTAGQVAWKDAELTDVATSQPFKISDFAGKTILVESFAVWCPKCLSQQEEFAAFGVENPDILLISLDTDANEDTEKVRTHIERYGFDWYFAVSPIEATNALIDEFGLGIVSAPSTPVILICADQRTRYLPSGIKSADDLTKEVAAGC